MFLADCHWCQERKWSYKIFRISTQAAFTCDQINWEAQFLVWIWLGWTNVGTPVHACFFRHAWMLSFCTAFSENWWTHSRDWYLLTFLLLNWFDPTEQDTVPLIMAITYYPQCISYGLVMCHPQSCFPKGRKWGCMSLQMLQWTLISYVCSWHS